MVAMPPEQMQQHLQAYFQAEKGESGFFIGVGALALVLGVVFLTRESAMLRGAAFPLAAVALIQLAVGLAVYLRTDRQVADLTAVMQREPARFVAEELPRMDKVNRNFVIYRYAELSLLVLGLGLAGFGFKERSWLLGIGAGLALQSALMLTLDFFAEARAEHYTAQIRAYRG